MNKIEINLSERDKKRFAKYIEQKLYHLDFDKSLEKFDIEFYNENNFCHRHKSLNYVKKRLATIKKDIKMFEKLKKALEVANNE